MPRKSYPGLSVALITAGATIVASQQQVGWLLVTAELWWAKRDRAE
ncbi:hypothetical protein [Haladaptatus halobius]|nr:hypothetical protein [Haladaptatus halobius]